MTAIAANVRQRPGRPAALLAVVSLVTLMAAAGALVAVQAIVAGEGAHSVERTHGIGDPIPTSFGTLTITRADSLGGLTAQDLGGVTHGIQNLVLSDEAQVEVSVRLVNTGTATVLVDPGQFSLFVEGRLEAVGPSGATSGPLSLDPGAGVETGIAFVVPQSGQRLALTYADPSGAAITVPIGEVGQAAPNTGTEDDHDDPH